MSELQEDLAQCYSKKRYSLKTANRVLERRLKGNPALRSYYCPVCFGYHLTKRPLKEQYK